MAIPAHYIHVNQRPAQGSSFIKRFQTYNYQHTISNQGGFDTASCDIAVRSESEGQTILNSYLGCFVQIYVDNPCEPIWEGLINRITFNSGGASYTISLDAMYNRVSVVYTAGANVQSETAVTDNIASQAIYGIKQGQIEFGGDTSAGTHRTVLRDTILANQAFPQTSYSQSQGQTNLVHFELIGIFHTLEWTNFTSVLTATTNTFSARIISLIGVDANAAIFYNNADTSLINSNLASTPNQIRGQSIWEVIAKIASGGDASNYWVVGVTPTDFNTKKRLVYYRQSNSVVEYTCRQSDGLKPRNLYGKPIPPWRIRPDRGIRVVDVLSGFLVNSGTFDPRATYIQSIQYDANQQKVQWFGADDTTARATFNLKNVYKPLSRAFGAPLRTLVT